MFLREHIVPFAGLSFILATLCAQPVANSQSAETSPRAAPPPAQELVLTFDPDRTIIHWTLPATLHTVHGTFRLKQGVIRLDPVSRKASGETVADARSGQSGNDGRDSKMHREVLESAKFPEIAFRPDAFVGNISQQGAFTAQLHGIFSLHGTNHEIHVPVQAQLESRRWKATATLSIPYVKWGLKNPSTFLLRVRQEVQIDLESAGTLEFADSP